MDFAGELELELHWKGGVFGHCRRLTRLAEVREMHAQLTTSRNVVFLVGQVYRVWLLPELCTSLVFNIIIFGSLYFF